MERIIWPFYPMKPCFELSVPFNYVKFKIWLLFINDLNMTEINTFDIEKKGMWRLKQIIKNETLRK